MLKDKDECEHESYEEYFCADCGSDWAHDMTLIEQAEEIAAREAYEAEAGDARREAEKCIKF